MNNQQGLFGKKTSLFGKPKQPEQSQSSLDMTEQINSLNGRLRVLEERLNNLNRKIEINETNDLEYKQKINIEFKAMNSEIVEIKRDIESVKEKIEIITREIPNLASRDEFEVLKKYIEMWEPMNFVTREELEKRLKELSDKKS